MEPSAEEIKSFVRERYAGLARAKSQSCCAPQAQVAGSSCCAGADSGLLSRVQKLYASERLDNLPDDVANFSLGCGNPLALAELKEGEVVLDLGSGGGLDCFLAAEKVGVSGQVIGLDMTPEMIQLARENAKKMGATNVEFRLGEMERMPLEDNSVDVVISNCVINLSPDKDAVFKEAYRVLKPGGRLSISDMVLLGELPQEVKASLEEWAGCIAGALQEKVYLGKIKAAGFVRITANRSTLPLYVEGQSGTDSGGKVASVRVKAFKPRRARKVKGQTQVK
ncbi:MAG: arsenite methyltransferase [Dehalococcoidales bacterium]|nr:arsenite methyltransferase [Dehalococcoidales bacterium]